jgi:hypothetical protein
MSASRETYKEAVRLIGLARDMLADQSDSVAATYLDLAMGALSSEAADKATKAPATDLG